ncbi:MAG: Glu/Leu/Phe/Val dehydrogenase dimerization domain-containing protein [Anaerolineales bacterium]
MMESLLREWDGETVIVRYDRPTDAWIFIAVHSSRLGPASGGTRMKHYASQEAALADALRLASGMTYKFAVPGIERGGGKAVISIPKDMAPDSRPDLLRRYGRLVQQLGGFFYTGPDLGTSPSDMDIISETGAPYVFSRTQEAGGAGPSGPITALGVFTGIQVACETVFGEATLKRRKVLVQGVGSVGRNLIEHLRNAEAEVMFSEVSDEIIQHFRDELGLQFIPGDEVYGTECDVFAPCALGGVLNEESTARLKCRIVAGGANNQLAHPEDAERLRVRGIIYAPDYVVNVGGAMAIPGIEDLGWSQAEAEERVTEGVRNALQRIFEMAEAESITTDEAARRIADEHMS